MIANGEVNHESAKSLDKEVIHESAKSLDKEAIHETAKSLDQLAIHGSAQSLDQESSLGQQQSIDIESPPPLTPTSSSVPVNLKLEHRLRTPWTYWYLTPQKELEWMERLKKVCKVDSVEQFWALYENIRPPSGLQMNCDYNLFRDDVQPVWEVPENIGGGRLVVQIDKMKMDQLDELWLELLMMLIGEQFGEDSSHVCGAVCNVRQKGHKICLWTKEADAEQINRRIGNIMKTRFQDCQSVKSNIRVNYEEHNKAQHKSSSGIQSRFFI